MTQAKITRRFLLAAAIPISALAQPDTPRNRTARAANAFGDLLEAWSKAFYKVKSGGIDVAECEAFEPMPKQWRAVEHTRMEWIRGTK